MNVGIIGLGSMGRRRLRLIQEHFNDILLCGVDTNEVRRKEVEKEFGIPTYNSITEAKNLFEMNSVFVCTSPITHELIIKEALNLDCNIFTEINLLNEYYDEIIEVAKKKDRLLYLSSTFLKRKEIQYIKSKVTHNKKISYQYHVGQYLPDWHPWEDYRNFFVSNKKTNGCREIFAIELPWIIDTFGKIKSFIVMTQKLSNLDIDYSDSFTLIIEHETGIVGTLSVDVVSRVAKRNLTIIGEKILIEWEGNPDSLFSWNEETSSMTNIQLYDEVMHDNNYSHTIIEDAYLEEIKEFFTLLENEMEPQYTFEKDKYIINLINDIEVN